MDSGFSMDLEALLAPILGENSTGRDIRKESSNSSIYYKIKDARNLARTRERQLVAGHEIEGNPLTEWKQVISLSQEILKNESKDLEVCAWLIEALLRDQQFSGLAQGFSITRQLCERYWDNLYPQPDEEGIETRVAALSGLNGSGAEGTLILPIANVTIAIGKNSGSFVFWQYQQSKAVSQMSDPDKQAKRYAEGVIKLDDIIAAINETEGTFYVNLIKDLEDCIKEYLALSTVLDDKCGVADAPPSSAIRESLTHFLDTIKFLAKDILQKMASLDSNSITPADIESVDPGATNLIKGIQGREEAFNQLLKIADFFLKTEPHSPISYLIQKVVRWGKLPLPELLKELITNKQVLSESCILSGIPESG